MVLKQLARARPKLNFIRAKSHVFNSLLNLARQTVNMKKTQRILLTTSIATLLIALASCNSKQAIQTPQNLEENLDQGTNVTKVIDAYKDDTALTNEVVLSAEPLPDLIISDQRLASSIRFASESFGTNSCSAQEGGFAPGSYKTMRFDAVTINNGTKDLEIGNPSSQSDPNRDGNPIDGLFEFARCHQHYHFRHYAQYELNPINPDGTLGTSVVARKVGFCMLDNYKTSSSGPRKFNSCDYQGVSKGWGDIYGANLDGQFFLLNEPGLNLQPGQYKVRLTVNPAYTPQAGEVCPVPMPNGQCRMFQEASYQNNTGETTVNISAAQLGQGAGNPNPTAPCSNCDLTSSGINARSSNYAPNASGFTTTARSLSAWLEGPQGTDFDLYLQRKTNSTWTNVARSDGYTSSERISYNAAAGTYRWQVFAYQGSGTYNLWQAR
jgi:Lysyl oxidase/Bacterial pre-peptidase C-terminal domain